MFLLGLADLFHYCGTLADGTCYNTCAINLIELSRNLEYVMDLLDDL